MICLFSYGPLLMDLSINFPPLRSSMNAKDRVHPFVPADGIVQFPRHCVETTMTFHLIVPLLYCTLICGVQWLFNPLAICLL